MLAGETNEKNGHNGYAQARADGYGLQYLALKDLLEVGENTEALEEIRTGHEPDEIYESWPPTPASLAAEFPSGRHHLRGYPGAQPDPEETLGYLVKKIEFNAQRADTKNSGVKKF